jgi:multidrug efflux system membrane fusion protein
LWAVGAIAFVVIMAAIVHARLTERRAPQQQGIPFRGGGGGGFGAALAVSVAKVNTGDVPITINSLGTVTPLATVAVHPQVTGPLVKIAFMEGQMVKAGDLLALIDPRPFQAALDQAQGQLQHDQAVLANARVDLVRYKTLVAQNSVAEQTYATQQATVLQDEATLTTDNAAVETAKLNLGYCRITSPVDGSVGLRQVDIGNMVTAYSTELVVVTQLHPMSVLFTVPEDNLSDVVQRLHAGEKLPVDAYDRTFTTKLDTGVLSNTDNEIDTTTGTLKLRAMFNNAQSELFPDQFVNVRMTLNTLHDQLLVPGAAVQNGANGNYVYVVNTSGASARPAFPAPAGGAPAADPPRRPRGAGGPGGGFGDAGPEYTVNVRYVKTGPTVGNMISIRSGLKVGETVVVDGADQLRDGASITIPASAPGAAAAGSPSDADAPGAPGAAGTAAGTAAGAYGAAGSAGAAHMHGRHGTRGYPGARPAAGQAGGAPAGAPAAAPAQQQ